MSLFGNGFKLINMLYLKYFNMFNMMDCDIVESGFKLQSHYDILFQPNSLEKGMNPLILLAIG